MSAKLRLNRPLPDLALHPPDQDHTELWMVVSASVANLQSWHEASIGLEGSIPFEVLLETVGVNEEDPLGNMTDPRDVDLPDPGGKITVPTQVSSVCGS